MAANNSCGSRSLRYGQMVDNVTRHRRHPGRRHQPALRLGPRQPGRRRPLDPRYLDLVRGCAPCAAREADEIGRASRTSCARSPATTSTTDRPAGHNMAKLLVGSEGTLAFFTALELDLAAAARRTRSWACATSRPSTPPMDATRHIVALGPAAVEVVDRTMIDLARDIPIFRPALETFVRGDARRPPPGRVRGRRAGRPAPGPAPPGRADGRSRLSRRRGRGRRPGAAAPRSGSCARPGSTS